MYAVGRYINQKKLFSFPYCYSVLIANSVSPDYKNKYDYRHNYCPTVFFHSETARSGLSYSHYRGFAITLKTHKHWLGFFKNLYRTLFKFYLIIHQLFPENRAVFEIMWKNMEKKYKLQKIIK